MRSENTKSPKSKKPRRGKGNSRRSSWQDRESKDMKRDDLKDSKSSNDPRWYGTDPALLRDSASIPFSWPLGQSFDLAYPVTMATFSNTKRSIPGICAVRLAPSMGAGTNSDALNVAAAQIYTYVRHTNAGHANYDPNDLMLYILGMTNVYSYINYLERIYALATCYEQRNRYLPDYIMRAMHVDPDSVKDNLAEFRYRINVLINKVSSIAVPATMTLFLRQAMIYAYVYSEGESIKDQLYLYYPDGFYQFALDSDSAGMLEYKPISYGTDRTYIQLISYGENMFNAIWEQEDFGIMSGDILKSYGDRILTLTSLNEIVPFAPVFDPMVLHQIKNASIIYGPDIVTSDLSIVQNAAKTKLQHEVHLSSVNKMSGLAAEYTGQKPKILTLDAAEPTPEMVIEATRLMVGTSKVEAGGGSYDVYFSTGSEIAVGVDYLTITDLANNTYWRTTMYSVEGYMTPGINVFRSSAILKAFKYAPAFDFLVIDADPPTNVVEAIPFQEVDNYAVIDNNDINKMHTAAMLNMLNVPSAAKNVTV